MVTAALVIAALAGAYLWMEMFVGPWRLASGLLDARTHLRKAERALERGAMKSARYETLSAVAAARRARDGYGSGGPVIDAARGLPKVGPILSEADHLVRASELAAAAAEGTLTIAESALRGPNKIIERDPADPRGGARIRIERIREIGGILADVRDQIRGVADELTAVDPRALPARLRRSVTDGIRQARSANERLADAAAGFEVLPGVLGEDGPRTYLIIMQNPAEQRGTGGSALRFSPLIIDNGKPTLPRGERVNLSVYDVDQDRRQFPDVPIPDDAWYQRMIPDARRFGNANWTPDWPLASELMLTYGHAAEADFPCSGCGDGVDGMIAVDPLMLQNLMPGVGPFRTNFGNLISEKRAVHFLVNRAYGSFGARVGQRREALKSIVEGFYDRMIQPARPTELMQGFGESLAEKHMQIWLADPTEQAFIERMEWGGTLTELEDGSDYLNVVEQNVGGNKLDVFLEQTHELDVRIEGDDAVNRAHVEVTNNAFLPQHRYVMGDSGGRFHGLMRPMMNVYVPGTAELTAATPDGQLHPMLGGAAQWNGSTPPEYAELGKKVWAVAFLLPIDQTASVTYDYRVPGVVRDEGARRVYRLVVQHQPKIHPHTLIVRLQLP
ncbi:MAG: DUF4012 domain-containing protein, partial [Actinomycetota bacterium]|nr:DUF4012 domain-containing protein [Actinomycetota bacterium]